MICHGYSFQEEAHHLTITGHRAPIPNKQMRELGVFTDCDLQQSHGTRINIRISWFSAPYSPICYLFACALFWYHVFPMRRNLDPYSAIPANQVLHIPPPPRCIMKRPYCRTPSKASFLGAAFTMQTASGSRTKKHESPAIKSIANENTNNTGEFLVFRPC